LKKDYTTLLLLNMGCTASAELVVSPSAPIAYSSSSNKKCEMFFSTKENDDGSIDVLLDVPCRSMWGQGEGMRGYCGETSF
jgi:hypothetical protein